MLLSRFSQIRELARFRVYGYLHGLAAVYKWGYASQYAHVHILICILVSRFSQISEEVFSLLVFDMAICIDESRRFTSTRYASEYTNVCISLFVCCCVDLVK